MFTRIGKGHRAKARDQSRSLGLQQESVRVLMLEDLCSLSMRHAVGPKKLPAGYISVFATKRPTKMRRF